MLRSVIILLCITQYLSVCAAAGGSCFKRVKRDYSYGAYADSEQQNESPKYGDAAYGQPQEGSYASSWSGGAADGTQGSLPNVEAIPGSSDSPFSQTGVGAKLVSSFTVTDLATIVTVAPIPEVQALNVEAVSTTPAPEATQSAGGSPEGELDVNRPVNSGVNARVVSSGDVVKDAAIPAVVTQASEAPSSSWSGEGNTANEPAWASSVYQVNAAQDTPTASASVPVLQPSITGVNAAPRGFETISTSIDLAALTGQVAAASATPALADSPQALNDASQDVEMPGQKLSVLPIGLGVFGGLALLGLIVVGFVTFERRKYRIQFREREAMETLRKS